MYGLRTCLGGGVIRITTIDLIDRLAGVVEYQNLEDSQHDEDADKRMALVKVAREWLAEQAAAQPPVSSSSAKLIEAVKKRIAFDHNDTCDFLLLNDPATYPCTCGHDALEVALAEQEKTEPPIELSADEWEFIMNQLSPNPRSYTDFILIALKLIGKLGDDGSIAARRGVAQVKKVP